MEFLGNGIVWDKEKNKALCSFEKGKFETEDMRIIKILLSLGYKTENGDEIVIENAEETDITDSDAIEDDSKHFERLSIRQLKEYCKKRKYTGYANLNKLDLLKFIKARE